MTFLVLPILSQLYIIIRKPFHHFHDIQPLTGGLTNANFILNGEMVYRLNGDYMLPDHKKFEILHGMNRRFEKRVLIRMSELHVSPMVILGDESRLVTLLLRNAESSPRIVGPWLDPLINLLIKVHTVKDMHLSEHLHMDAIRFINKYWNIRTKDAEHHTIGHVVGEKGLGYLLDKCQYLWDLSTVNLFSPQGMRELRCVVHNDLVGGNLIHTKDDDRYWLIDWEYSSVGIGLHDYANMAAVNDYTIEEDRELISRWETHTNETYTPEEREVLIAQHVIIKVLQNIREGLWGIVMHYMIPDLVFNCSWSSAKSYEEYGMHHLQNSASFMKSDEFLKWQQVLEREVKEKRVSSERLVEIAGKL